MTTGTSKSVSHHGGAIDRSVMDQSTVAARQTILHELVDSPIDEPERIRNLGLYLLPMDLKRLLFLDSLYRQIVSVPGIIVELGCRWGQNLATFQSLRAIYEPYNHRRTIVGFDTFQGFPSTHEKDGGAEIVHAGAYGVASGYQQYLEKLLRLRESQSPLAQVQKFQLVAGDASETFPAYLQDHPESILSLVYFDMDLYQPTADCLRAMMPHVSRGSVIAFDQVNHVKFPGETRALKEVLGLPNIRLQRNRWCADESFFVVQ